jgi:CBS domain containing-hemolysin-like protein
VTALLLSGMLVLILVTAWFVAAEFGLVRAVARLEQIRRHLLSVGGLVLDSVGRLPRASGLLSTDTRSRSKASATTGSDPFGWLADARQSTSSIRAGGRSR